MILPFPSESLGLPYRSSTRMNAVLPAEELLFLHMAGKYNIVIGFVTQINQIFRDSNDLACPSPCIIKCKDVL